MAFLGKFLKFIAPRSFNDGLFKCNELGKKLIIKRKVEKFLDLGCGNGSLTLEFAKIVQPQEIHGVEFNDENRKLAETRGIICGSWDLNSHWKYNDAMFDVILSSQNIEHLHNTQLYLQECFRCLKPGGQLIVLTENLASWINIFSLIFGWMPFSSTNINGLNLGNPFIWHADEPKDTVYIKKWENSEVSGILSHVRVLAYQGLFDLLKKLGFRNIRIFTKGYLPLYGMISDLFCCIDKRHGHFLIASAQK